MSILNCIIHIFNFNANGYAWYIKMYIGLFLLIPFLNILYKNLKSKKNKQYLILTILFMTSLSPMINYFKIGDINLELIPDWWNQIYPLGYYFIGCYIHEYQIKINRKKGIVIILGILLLETIITYLFNYNHPFNPNFFEGYHSLQTVIISTTLFLLLYCVQSNHKMIQKWVRTIALLSLDIYLFSYISDNIIYPYVNLYIKTPKEYLKWYIFIVFMTFMISFILASMKKLIFDYSKKIWISFIQKNSNT